MSLELRRRLMATEPTDIIIDARYGGVSGNPANDAALMQVIYARKWSKSSEYMTKREAEAVTDIGTYFSNHIDIVDLEAFGYFSSVETVEYNAFAGLTYLKRISIPKNVKYGYGIESTMPTEYMYSLSVNSENPIYSSLDNVLYKNSTTLVLVPKSVEGEIVVRERVTEISSYAFQNCKKVERIVLPDSITAIGQHAFRYCESLQEINLPKKLTALNIYVFDYCPSLTLSEFNLPDVVKTSGGYFGGRNNPPKRINNTRLYLPKVTGEIATYIYGTGSGKIGYVYIGEGCTKITAINPYVNTTIYVCMASTPPTLLSLAAQRDVCGKELYVPRDAIQQYRDNEYWAGSFTDIYAVEDIDSDLLAYMKFETDILPQ